MTDIEAAEVDGLTSPFKALRLQWALLEVRDEMDHCAVDEAACRRLVTVHRANLAEAARTVSSELADEMARLHMAPLSPDATLAEIRVAHTQLAGWLTGLLLGAGAYGRSPDPTTGPSGPSVALDPHRRPHRGRRHARGAEVPVV